MKVGIDLDGTISRAGFYNPSLRLPSFLFVFILPIVLFLLPSRHSVAKLRLMNDDGDEIIIISARPKWTRILTEQWLRLHGIPFQKLHCVGFGKGTKQRKLEVIKREDVEQFFDDDSRIVNFLNQNSIRATTHF